QHRRRLRIDQLAAGRAVARRADPARAARHRAAGVPQAGTVEESKLTKTAQDLGRPPAFEFPVVDYEHWVAGGGGPRPLCCKKGCDSAVREETVRDGRTAQRPGTGRVAAGDARLLELLAGPARPALPEAARRRLPLPRRTRHRTVLAGASAGAARR